MFISENCLSEVTGHIENRRMPWHLSRREAASSGEDVRPTVDFSARILDGRRRQDRLRSSESKCDPNILSPAKLSFEHKSDEQTLLECRHSLSAVLRHPCRKSICHWNTAVQEEKQKMSLRNEKKIKTVRKSLAGGLYPFNSVSEIKQHWQSWF